MRFSFLHCGISSLGKSTLAIGPVFQDHLWASRQIAQETKEDRKRIRELERELARKEKALAEAAALLVLQKKAEAIWGRRAGEDE